MPIALLAIPRHLGYLALGALIGGESMGVPLPGESALIAAAVLAHQGRLHLGAVVGVAATAAIVGDNLGYLLGRRGGRRLLDGPGPLRERRRRFLHRGERFFARHGAKAVFLGRWVPGLRASAAWLAGTNKMPWKTFFLWNALGGLAWSMSVGLIGFTLGAAGARVLERAGLTGLLAALVVAAGVLAWIWRRRTR